MNFKDLPHNIRRIIAPIIDELIEENETLNQEEFIIACDHLYELLEYTEKKELFSFGQNVRKKYVQETFLFKPKINKNSERINQKLYQEFDNNNNTNSNFNFNPINNIYLTSKSNNNSSNYDNDYNVIKSFNKSSFCKPLMDNLSGFNESKISKNTNLTDNNLRINQISQELFLKNREKGKKKFDNLIIQKDHIEIINSDDDEEDDEYEEEEDEK